MPRGKGQAGKKRGHYKESEAVELTLSKDKKSWILGNSKTERRTYDTIRNVHAQHRTGIYIGEQQVNLSEINQITSSGRRLPASTRILKESEAKRDKKGKLGKNEAILEKGESITSYQISTDVIKPTLSDMLTGKRTANISIEKVETVIIKKPKIIGKRQPNRIYFRRVGTDLIVSYSNGTPRNIEPLFTKAEQKTGSRVIFINNTAFVESDFVRGADGRWRLIPSRVDDLHATERNGMIAARYSERAMPQFEILAETEKVLTQKAPQVLYGQEKSIATLVGGDVGGDVEAILNEYSIDARIAIKYLKQVTREKGEGYSVIATDFTATKQGKIIMIGLDKMIKMSDASKSNYYGFVFPNTSGTENATKFQAYDEFIQISIVGDKLSVTIVSPDLEWSGLMPIPGSP